ncbi:hypothetical protein FO519_006543 [Halicephalobus sp. NKZ332]|nr:hypothetical protein FO519_006543 [Halicephalobus sp. NKZ332]
MKIKLLLIVAIFSSENFVSGFVDNGILGDPYVQCGADRINIRFDTRSTFRGIVFVQDHLSDPECRSAPVEGSSSSIRNASLSLGFKDCGVERRPSADPKGIFLTTSLIVAFNPEFLTKIDKIYVIQCYYMEMENMLEKQISVSMPPPTLHTQQVPMPVCRYEVLDGSPEGPPVFYATIGQMVYHKWTCEAQTENQFCMTVHSCTVDDGNGDKVELINEDGCAKDKYLLQNLDYVSDLMVGKEAHVYKYADKQSMFFDCQITLTIKEPGQQYCDVPNCPDPPRRRRAQIEEAVSPKISLSRNPENLGLTEVESEFIIPQEEVTRPSWTSDHISFENENLCLSLLGLSSMSFVNIILLSTSGALFYNAYRNIKEF